MLQFISEIRSRQVWHKAGVAQLHSMRHLGVKLASQHNRLQGTAMLVGTKTCRVCHTDTVCGR
jgi:hypothetical protein